MYYTLPDGWESKYLKEKIDNLDLSLSNFENREKDGFSTLKLTASHAALQSIHKVQSVMEFLLSKVKGFRLYEQAVAHSKVLQSLQALLYVPSHVNDNLE